MRSRSRPRSAGSRRQGLSPIAADIAALEQPAAERQSALLILRFLPARHRGWPGETGMRRRPKRSRTRRRRGDRFFANFPPLTPPATPVYAFALSAAAAPTRRGPRRARLDRRRDAGRRRAAPAQHVRRHAHRADHDARMDACSAMATPRAPSAASPGARQQGGRSTRRGWRCSRARPTPRRGCWRSARPDGDAGLLIDRANWLRETGDSLGARQLLAQRRQLKRRRPIPRSSWKRWSTMARGAVNDRQWSLA
jgi:soluble lytic murein transglycosylase